MVNAATLRKIVRALWSGSIRSQLIVGFGAAALVLLLLFGYRVIEQQREFLHQFGDERAVSFAHALSISSTSWAMANDLVGLQEVVHGFVKTPDLRRAYFVNPQGQVLASTQPDEVGYFLTDELSKQMLASEARDQVRLHQDANLIVVAHPVMAGGQRLGWVRVEMTRESVNANLAELGRHWIEFVLFAMLAVALLAIVLARRLITGLNHLTQVASEVEQGRDQLRADMVREDEIGLLARHMNRMLDALDRQQSLLRSTIDSVPDLIFIKDTESVYLGCNREVERLLGRMEQQIIGKTDYDWFDKTLADSVRENDRRVIESGEPHSNEEWLTYPDGHKILVETIKTPFRAADGSILGVIGVCRDITERKKVEELIRNMAFYDTLTGLPNRRLLLDRMGQTMSASKRSGRFAALMFLDLDNFKPLNDAYGHDVGDLLLVEVAHRITGCVRKVDTVARFGGDEFVVMISELDVDRRASYEQARFIAEKIRGVLAESYVLTMQQEDGEVAMRVEHHCTASIGVVLFLGHQFTGEEILKRADMAMYQAKQDGRNVIRDAE